MSTTSLWSAPAFRTVSFPLSRVRLLAGPFQERQSLHARYSGKTRVTVRFEAHAGSVAGGLFGLRVMRAG